MLLLVDTKSQHSSAGEKQEENNGWVCHSHKIFTKKATGDCVVFPTQLIAGSHTEKAVVALRQSLLTVSLPLLCLISLLDCKMLR